ncbi:hypothetical protein ACFO1B_41095 [Dactylosporangium siamense]|uniref:Uncharacterized protein n=1 Tax=Dactylosporangium siamense TaxID=685454 RepID=A0A919U8X6_9ACTN|nr:hypothetical protein [Dactylosporangium siamense]GIG42656.1 hypothetical protein Dsi01nite_006970 [Dactylosporangium siamense]
MSDAPQVPTGIVIPTVDGSPSTSALGRAVVADALRSVAPSWAAEAGTTTNWRRDYLRHFHRLVEAGLPSREAALTVAADGLGALRSRMRYRMSPDLGEQPLDAAFDAPAGAPLRTVTVAGAGEVRRELVVPYRGERLHGASLDRQLDRWVEGGVIEASCAAALRTVAANPSWLALPDRPVVVLGAGAEMGPLTALLRWGADVVAVDLPRPAIWQRLLETAHRSGGRLHVPVSSPDDTELSRHAGADLLHDLRRVADWLGEVGGAPVLGNYVYADGPLNVRVAVAVDALTVRLRETRPDLALAFLATPTDVFAVPDDAVEESARRYAGAKGVGRLRGPLRVLSGGRLLAPNYPAGRYPGINDSLVPQQGPNYALAKRLQRWRAAHERAAGATVSLTVAPATRTRSVLKNRLLAAAYAGAHRFGIEIFEPATSNTLMAALLVHDLHVPRPGDTHPWQDEADAAAHGGLWRQPYAPRSALGLAVLFGFGVARG